MFAGHRHSIRAFLPVLRTRDVPTRGILGRVAVATKRSKDNYIAYFSSSSSSVSSLSSSSTSSTSTTTSDAEAPREIPEGCVFQKMACIGTGKMATALMEPLVKTGLQRAENMFVYDVFPSAMQKVSDRLGVQMAGSLPELVQDADLVICAVKPQNLTADFFRELRKGTPHEDAILLSVVAGKSIHVFSHEGDFRKLSVRCPILRRKLVRG